MATPEELKVLAEIDAAKERGEDPFGDNDEPQAVPVEATEPIEPVDPAEEATEELAVEPKELQEPTVYRAEVPGDYREQRAVLLKEKAGLMKKLMEGEIDPDDFAANEARISDSLEDLTAQRIRAETLQEATKQSQAVYQQREIQRLITKTKGEVDYATDAKAQRQFDMTLNAVMADPDNAGKDYADLLGEAHKVVLALRGIVSKGQVIEQAIKARIPEGKPPVTLRNIPAAATPNANGNMLDQMGRLTGQAYQDAFSKLSPTQRKALLDEA